MIKKPEYISREAANDTINETAYEYEDDKALTALYHAADKLNDLPAADVVEVVRCVECQHYNDKLEMYCDYVCTIRHYCDGSPIIVGKDDFCSSGRRKDGGQEE